jgi:NAD+ synthase (glutamine-hydrolysing)
VPQLRIALAQVNSTVGDLDGNAAAIMKWTAAAAAAGARVVVFPEMMLTGYPVEDLALRGSFVTASIEALRVTAARLADAGLGGIAVVTGYLDRQAGLVPRVGLPAGAPRDAAAVLHGGSVTVTSAKHHLPNYGVFDEFRYFVPGDVLPVFRIAANSGEPVDVAVAICEDLWQDGGPVAVARQARASPRKRTDRPSMSLIAPPPSAIWMLPCAGEPLGVIPPTQAAIFCTKSEAAMYSVSGMASYTLTLGSIERTSRRRAPSAW